MKKESLAQKTNSKKKIQEPTKEQEEVLSNPKILTTYIYLLDNPANQQEISTRTKFSLLATSVYLESLKTVGLISKKNVLKGKSKYDLYEAINPSLNLSGLTDKVSPITTLNLLYNKIKSDLTDLYENNHFSDKSNIKYSQVKVRKGTYYRIKALMEEIEELINNNEINGEEEAITLLQIVYQQVDYGE